MAKPDQAKGDRAGHRAERIRRALEVFDVEARAIAQLGERVGDSFGCAIELILNCQGNVVVTGMGKAGIIGQKISATLASTGTPSTFLHPAEALHGDLGRIRSGDVVLALSNSGETVEISQVLVAVKKIGAEVIGMTGKLESSLAKLSDCVLHIGDSVEACPLGLAPTASTAAMLGLGDALAVVVQTERNFSREDYARFHPAGSLGRRLMRVEEIMRKGAELPLVKSGQPLRETLLVMTETPGKPGAALVVDANGKLLGIFTDGDIRRLLSSGQSVAGKLEDAVDGYMAREPLTVRPDMLVEEAEHLLHEHRKDQIPVLDTDGRPAGLVDVQDLLDIRLSR